jgi:hypothetical protein
MPLSTTTNTTASPYCAAVASSCPFIRKQPSPFQETTRRCGQIALAATAAGTP